MSLTGRVMVGAQATVLLLFAVLARAVPSGYTTMYYDKVAGCVPCGQRGAVVEGACSDYVLNPARHPRCANNCIYGSGCPAPSGDFYSNSSPFLDHAAILATFGSAKVLVTGSGPYVVARPSGSSCGNGTEYALLPDEPNLLRCAPPLSDSLVSRSREFLDAEGLVIVQVVLPGESTTYPPFAPVENEQGLVCPAGVDFGLVVTQLHPTTRAILRETLKPIRIVDLRFVPAFSCAPPAAAEALFQVDPVDWIQDAFPANETAGLPNGSAINVPFDTTTALVKTGRNIAQLNLGAPALRFDIPGDTLVVRAPEANVRLDLVFRVLPGPGNYHAFLGRSKQPGGMPVGTLLQLPTNQAAVALSGDGSFWGQYIASPGEFSAGVHTGPHGWNPHTWNSARMDTAEVNIFPVQPLGNLPRLSPGLWAAMYHESDPKFVTLGVNKFLCFVVDTTKAANSSPGAANVTCDGTIPPWLTTVPQSRTGWNGSNTTTEFTKILPDGLFTPGSHIQYFVRKSNLATPATFAMVPDTTLVTPQTGKGSVTCSGDDDGHRWHEFSVLPDRWKFPGYGGAGAATMLYVNLDDQHGDERAWTTVAELIGATAPAAFGGHNGWHAPAISANPNDPANFVRAHNGQAGTRWDKYHVRGTRNPLSGHAGALSGRLANRAGMGLAGNKYSRQGPTPEMLRTYYRMVYATSGDVADALGPLPQRSQNDVALLNDFLTASGGTLQPRAIWVEGSGLVAGETAAGVGDPSHTTFLTSKLGLSLRSPSYATLSGNAAACVGLGTAAPQVLAFGLQSDACETHDVLNRNTGLSETVDAAFYQNVGGAGPYLASVFKPASATRNWFALTDGWDLKRIKAGVCGTDSARIEYVYNTLKNAFSPFTVVSCPQAQIIYRDADGDGYGSSSATLTTCSGWISPGWVPNNMDCNDADASVHPGASEATCNGIDNDCDGTVDEGFSACVCNGSGLAGWWRGNGNASDEAAGNHGTLVGGAGYAAGKVGQAFSLNGTDAYVSSLGDLNSYAFIENSGVFTINAWINLSDVFAHSQQAITASTGTSIEKGHFFIWENSSGEQKLRLALMKAISGTPVIESGSPNQVITTNGWHHVAAVGNGTTVTFYVDGIGYAGTGTMGPKPSGASTRAVDIGRCPYPTPQCHFNGLIDELEIHERALSASEVQAVYNAGGNGTCGTGCAQGVPGLVGWWPGSGDAADRSPLHQNGLLAGSVSFTPGKVGPAFSFTGTSTGYVALPNAAALQLSSQFTLAAWIKPNDVSNNRQIISKWSLGPGDYAYQMNIYPGGSLRADVSDDGSRYEPVISPGGALTAGVWKHVAATFSAGVCKLYVDGVLVTTESTSPITSIHPTTTVGPYLGVGNGDVQRFSGLIDEPMVFNRALSGEEIASIYQAGASGMCGLGLVNVEHAPTLDVGPFALAAPWPNPSTRLTHVQFRLPTTAKVRADVFDVVGRRVASLIDGQRMPGGEHRVTWDGRDISGQRVAPGIYQVRVTTDEALAVRKIVMVQ